MEKPMRAEVKSVLFAILLAALAGSSNRVMAKPAVQSGKGVVRPEVTVILDKLPEDKRQKMGNFAEKLRVYIATRVWIEEDYVRPFKLGLQLFLEDDPYPTEDRYRCSLIASGPDIQYYDKRALFPFQASETIQESGAAVPVRTLIDFYVYLVIANELDKYGENGGDVYFAKARALMQEGKYSQYAYGWDWREDTVLALTTDNYKKFRVMKDYYFYGLWSTQDEPDKTRHYTLQALKRLEEVLKENKDNLAAKQFIDAHYQEVIEIFKNGKDSTAFQIMTRLDPERENIYKEFIASND
jgi:hypothetical protein